MWKPGRSNRFKKGYKKIGAELLKRVNKALKTLLESEHPENIGQIKTGAKKKAILVMRLDVAAGYYIFPTTILKFLNSPEFAHIKKFMDLRWVASRSTSAILF